MERIICAGARSIRPIAQTGHPQGASLRKKITDTPHRPGRATNLARSIIQQREETADLPKYSPDLNPIEQFFAKFKHWLRKAAQRTTEPSGDAIAPIFDTVSPAECANYFTDAGYNQT